MEVQLRELSKKEANLSILGGDIGILYIIQDELGDRFVGMPENSKYLLSTLCNTAAKRANDVDLKLQQLSADISQSVSAHVENNLEEMLTFAALQYPSLLSEKEGDLANDIRQVCYRKLSKEKSQTSPELISTLINKHVRSVLHNAVNKINLIMANNIASAITGT